jgi:hypothetical protein
MSLWDHFRVDDGPGADDERRSELEDGDGDDASLDDEIDAADAYDPLEDASLDDDFELGDGNAEMTATIVCPYCGEPNEVALDPGSGPRQDYVEDCQVCCQPWRVHVRYGADGAAQVWADTADDA